MDSERLWLYRCGFLKISGNLFQVSPTWLSHKVEPSGDENMTPRLEFDIGEGVVKKIKIGSQSCVGRFVRLLFNILLFKYCEVKDLHRKERHEFNEMIFLFFIGLVKYFILLSKNFKFK